MAQDLQAAREIIGRRSEEVLNSTDTYIDVVQRHPPTDHQLDRSTGRELFEAGYVPTAVSDQVGDDGVVRIWLDEFSVETREVTEVTLE